METVVFPMEDGGQVLVRVAEGDAALGGPTMRGGGGSRLEQAAGTFEGALGAIRRVAEGVLGQLGGMARSPDEVSVEFCLELTAKAGAIMVAAETAAHLRVELTWRPAHGGGGAEGKGSG